MYNILSSVLLLLTIIHHIIIITVGWFASSLKDLSELLPSQLKPELLHPVRHSSSIGYAVSAVIRNWGPP